MSAAQRRAATEQHQFAIAAINDLFDKLEGLAAARDRLTGIEPLAAGADPIRDAETLLTNAGLLHAALNELRAAALAAAEHRNRNDLAADIGTKRTVLFPRPTRRPAAPPHTLERQSPDPVILHDETS